MSALTEENKTQISKLAEEILNYKQEFHKKIEIKKPPEKKEKKVRFVCKVCGYVYEGDELPEDFTCPLCAHPASDFVREEY